MSSTSLRITLSLGVNEVITTGILMYTPNRIRASEYVLVLTTTCELSAGLNTVVSDFAFHISAVRDIVQLEIFAMRDYCTVG